MNELVRTIEKELADLAEFTATPGNGVTRFPFTEEAKAAIAHLDKLMTNIGLKTHMDNSGALIGRLEGETSDTIMIGSHYDSVKNGGAYDGIAGVVCAIEVAHKLIEEKQKLHYSLEVIATNDEEGSRFHTGLFTGKVLFGQWSAEDIKKQIDDNGLSVYEAMQGFGLKPEEIQKHQRDNIKAFIEIHIEQGPVLEHAKKAIGIVDTIVGIKRTHITINGRADHAGTMPMLMRKDALAMAAKAISPLDDRAKQYPDTVTTVGYFSTLPNVTNIIPETVSYTVDMRAVTEDILTILHKHMLADLEALSKKMAIPYTVKDLLYAEPVDMSKTIRDCFDAICKEKSISYMHLVSGAGHDAQIFGKEIPAAMLFVPSFAGRSHCPEEKSSPEDLALAVEIAHDAILRLNDMKEIV